MKRLVTTPSLLGARSNPVAVRTGLNSEETIPREKKTLPRNISKRDKRCPDPCRAEESESCPPRAMKIGLLLYPLGGFATPPSWPDVRFPEKALSTFTLRCFPSGKGCGTMRRLRHLCWIIACMVHGALQRLCLDFLRRLLGGAVGEDRLGSTYL